MKRRVKFIVIFLMTVSFSGVLFAELHIDECLSSNAAQTVINPTDCAISHDCDTDHKHIDFHFLGYCCDGCGLVYSYTSAYRLTPTILKINYYISQDNFIPLLFVSDIEHPPCL